MDPATIIHAINLGLHAGKHLPKIVSMLKGGYRGLKAAPGTIDSVTAHTGRNGILVPHPTTGELHYVKAPSQHPNVPDAGDHQYYLFHGPSGVSRVVMHKTPEGATEYHSQFRDYHPGETHYPPAMLPKPNPWVHKGATAREKESDSEYPSMAHDTLADARASAISHAFRPPHIRATPRPPRG